MGFLAPFAPIIIIAVIIVLIVLFLLVTIKVVPGNQALVVTGVGATKKIVETVQIKVIDDDGTERIVEEERTSYIPKIKIAGAAFVVPFIQHGDRFTLDIHQTGQKSDIVKTKTGVEVMIDWVIAYAPNTRSVEDLNVAIQKFMGKAPHEVEDTISSVVAGGVRAVVSTMEPIEVMVGKEELDQAVQKNIADDMAELGYTVQLYIQEVKDTPNSEYFANVAAEDRENTRRNAANITATNNQSIREREAETNKAAKDAELKAEVEIAEKTRDTEVRKAEFKAETDRANADAEIAHDLRQAEREKELATNQGQIEVERKLQANLAAQKEQEVEVTKAETSRKKQEIEAEAQAAVAKRTAEGQAQAEIAKADGEAKAVKTRAEATAAKAKTEGQAQAEVTKISGQAQAEVTRANGEAEADAIRAKGQAEADNIRAKGLAEAEAERKLAEARAAEERVNFEIQKLEIQRDTTISVATSIATAMAHVGENATFYDFSGSGGDSGDGGNLLVDVMKSIPRAFGEANLTNLAVNDEVVTDTMQRLAQTVMDPLGQAISGQTPIERPAGKPVTGANKAKARLEAKVDQPKTPTVSKKPETSTEKPETPAEKSEAQDEEPGSVREKASQGTAQAKAMRSAREHFDTFRANSFGYLHPHAVIDDIDELDDEFF